MRTLTFIYSDSPDLHFQALPVCKKLSVTFRENEKLFLALQDVKELRRLYIDNGSGDNRVCSHNYI